MTISTPRTQRALLPLAGLAASLSTSFSAYADVDRVVREYTFPLSAIEEVDFRASVGSLRIETIEADEIRLVLEIESKDGGWFDRRRDVSDVELESDVRGKRLRLEQTEEDTTTDWTVQMPAVARTTINMGVGEIDAELGATELDIDLGVGDVDVSLPAVSTGAIDISVGVGDARLRGADDVDYEKAFVSQEARGRGAGELEARIDVGVGEVTLNLE